jgi:hypothetical protein
MHPLMGGQVAWMCETMLFTPPRPHPAPPAPAVDLDTLAFEFGYELFGRVGFRA